VLAIAFSGGLALQSSYQADFAGFINANTAEIVGLLIANTTSIIFRTIDPVWNALRISRTGWRAVRQLAISDEVDVQGWTLPMFDRVGLVMSRLGDAELPKAVAKHIDPLRDLRVGLNLAALKQAEGEFPIGVQAVLRRVRDDVSDTYDGFASGRQLARGDLRASIEEGIKSISTQPPSVGRRAGLAALTLLRLDLGPATEPYVPEAVAA
jgi:uncharacterized membrane protein YccC